MINTSPEFREIHTDAADAVFYDSFNTENHCHNNVQNAQYG